MTGWLVCCRWGARGLWLKRACKITRTFIHHRLLIWMRVCWRMLQWFLISVWKGRGVMLLNANERSIYLQSECKLHAQWRGVNDAPCCIQSLLMNQCQQHLAIIFKDNQEKRRGKLDFLIVLRTGYTVNNRMRDKRHACNGRNPAARCV